MKRLTSLLAFFAVLASPSMAQQTQDSDVTVNIPEYYNVQSATAEVAAGVLDPDPAGGISDLTATALIVVTYQTNGTNKTLYMDVSTDGVDASWNDLEITAVAATPTNEYLGDDNTSSKGEVAATVAKWNGESSVPPSTANGAQEVIENISGARATTSITMTITLDEVAGAASGSIARQGSRVFKATFSVAP